MIENIKHINNPLTIIALFAGLAEIAGTVALGIVDTELQKIFVWFVMLFPTFLVFLFFLTLNFNTKVLYAPSDFRDENNFITTLVGDSLQTEKTVEVNKENLQEIKEELKENEQLLNSKKGLGDKNNTVIAANVFFSYILGSVDPFYEDEKLSSLGFGMHSDEFYLLSFDLPKNKLPAKRTSHFDFIIRVTENESGIITFEIIGKDIKSHHVQEFSILVIRRIKEIINQQFNLSENDDSTSVASDPNTEIIKTK